MKIVALMGEAGSGKDTILRKVMELYPSFFHEIISCTTRPPREGEVDGINYHFLEVDEFKNQEMLESTEFNGWYYGTSKSSLSEDKINIGVFNPAGVRSLMQIPDIDLTVYYVRASDKVRLIRQLNREENPDVEEIIRRFSADKQDFEVLYDIDFINLPNVTKANIVSNAKRILANIH